MSDLVEDRFVEMNGVRFHYRDWQPKKESAPSLVCLHGLGGNSHVWDTTARAIQDRYRVLAIDQRGHGETDWADDYGWKARVGDLRSLVDALGLSPVTLIGHSLGGFISYVFAALHSDLMSKLVIVDDGPDILRGVRPRLERAAEQGDVFDSPDEDFRRMREANSRASDSELWRWVTPGIRQRDDGKWVLRSDPAMHAPDAPRRNDLNPKERWAMLPKIGCPTLLVRGADSVLLPAQSAERMVREIRSCAFVEIPNAGHLVPLENPDGFIAALRSFL